MQQNTWTSGDPILLREIHRGRENFVLIRTRRSGGGRRSRHNLGRR